MLVAELAWQTFRNTLVLEYEIPKFEGDLGQPNLYVPLSSSIAERKIEHLLGAFPSQAHRYWYSEETFRAVLRLRGIELNAASGYAEAFTARKNDAGAGRCRTAPSLECPGRRLGRRGRP